MAINCVFLVPGYYKHDLLASLFCRLTLTTPVAMLWSAAERAGVVAVWEHILLLTPDI